MLLVAVLCAMSLLGGVQAVAAFDDAISRSGRSSVYSLAPRSDLENGAWSSGYRLLADGGNDVAPIGDVMGNDKDQPPPLDSPPPLGRDWVGIATDTGEFAGYLLATTTLLYFLPEDWTGWSDREKRYPFEAWWDNVKNPHWDSDAWWVNYIVHPYWGATYYVRARERGFGYAGSFAYAVLLSTLFELVEAFFEPVSYQDLLVTPVAGALVGAFLFEPLRNWVKAKPEMKWYDHTIMVATDPFGGLNAVVEWMFGIKSEVRLQFRPLADLSRDRPATSPGASRGPEGTQRRADGVGFGLLLRY